MEIVSKKEKKAIGKLKTAVNNVAQAEKKKRKPRRRTQQPRKGTNWVNVPSSRPRVRRLTARLAARGVSDALLEDGTEQMLRTLFSGEEGISRGIAAGVEPTALTRFRGSIDVNVANGTTLSFAWSPTNVLGPNWLTYNNQTTPVSPFGTGTVAVPGPLNGSGAIGVNPSSSYRIVRAALRILPLNPVISQGGVSSIAYYPALFAGAAASSGFQVTNWSLTTIQNCTYYRDFRGSDDIVLQWFPNDSEIYMNNNGFYTNTVNVFSGFIGVLTMPVTGNSSNVRFEWDLGFEYTPNDTYRPFVSRSMPNIFETAKSMVNMFVSQEWNRACLATKPEYDAMTVALDPVKHHLTTSYLANSVAGFAPLTTPAKSMGVFEKGKAAIEDTCGMFEDATGYNICGALNNASTRVTNALLANTGAGLMPTRGMIGM